ncbi:MAG: hypothetical protein WCH11_03190, partial [Bdellovibrio sp.]
MNRNREKLKILLFDSLMVAYLLMVVWVKFVRALDGSFDLGKSSLVFLIFALFGAFISWICNLGRVGARSSLGQIIFEAPHQKAAREAVPWFKSVSGWQLTVFLLVTFFIGAEITQISFDELRDQEGFEGA